MSDTAIEFQFNTISLTNLVAVIYKDIQIVKQSDASLVTNNPTNLPLAAITLTDSADAFYIGTVPPDLLSGTYVVRIYQKAGASLAVSDTLDVLGEGELDWDREDTDSFDLIDYDRFIRKWTNKTLIEVTDKEHVGLTEPDEDLINDAFRLAEAQINSLLKGGPYALPLDFGTNGVDPIVEEWGMVLAFARLYYDRFDDSATIQTIDGTIPNQTGKVINSRYKEVLTEIAMYTTSGGPMITGASLDSSFNTLPSILSTQDIMDARTGLDSAGSRTNIYP